MSCRAVVMPASPTTYAVPWGRWSARKSAVASAEVQMDSSGTSIPLPSRRARRSRGVKIELLVSTRNFLPDALSASMNSWAPGMGSSSCTRTPSMSVSQVSIGRTFSMGSSFHEPSRPGAGRIRHACRRGGLTNCPFRHSSVVSSLLFRSVTGSGRFVAYVVSIVLLGAVGVTTGAAPAEASVTKLCTGYTACARAGMSSAGYSSANRSMYWRMYAGHNCTNYVAYRMVHSGLSSSRPWTGSGNATNWGRAMSRITNSTPAVGAVAWWKAGVKPAGSVGHVAYVERVVSANEIIVSQDSWGGDFSWARITRTNGGWPSGFIHFNDVRLQNTVKPTITGTAKVGSTLTVSRGTWNPTDATFAYQWKANGVAIAGATSTTLKPALAHVGKRITVQVTASHPGYTSVAALSASTAAVLPGVLSNTTAPAIKGDPRVDSILEADPGTWTPTPDTIGYQWRAGGAVIAGATGQTLAVGPELVGKAITVTVNATKTGYAA